MISFVFFGTGPFGARVLKSLINRHKLRPAQVVTAPPKPKGRGQKLTPSPVFEVAHQAGLDIFMPESLKKDQLIKKLAPAARELIVLADYGFIIPKWLLEHPEHGIVNVHPSLLPRWRGAAPVQFSILAGDKETGVTLIKLDDKLDHGPIIAQEKINIKAHETTPQLSARLAYLGAKLLGKSLPRWCEKKIKATPQNHIQATFTRRLTKQDGQINWNEPAKVIERRIRAFQPWPGAYTFFNADATRKRLRILEARIVKKEESLIPGVITNQKDRLVVGTGDGALDLLIVQPEGKRQIKGREFIQGHQGLQAFCV